MQEFWKQASKYGIFIKSVRAVWRGNNNAISGIPDNNTDDKLEDVVMKILADVDVIVEASDIEARHRFCKSDRKTIGKKKIIRFPNRKNCEKGVGTFSVGITTCL